MRNTYRSPESQRVIDEHDAKVRSGVIPSDGRGITKEEIQSAARAEENRQEILKRPDDKATKIEFLKRWGKPIPASLLAREARGARTGPDPEKDETKPPLWVGVKSDRVLVSGENLTIVDDEVTCDGQQHVSPLWHIYRTYSRYAEARWERIAVRCPRSLDGSEWLRVVARGEARRFIENRKATRSKDAPEAADTRRFLDEG